MISETLHDVLPLSAAATLKLVERMVMLRLLLIAIGLYAFPSGGAGALAADAASKARNELADAETLASIKLQAAVQEAFHDYFANLGLPKPDIAATAKVRLAEGGKGAAPTIVDAKVEAMLNPTTSPPEQVIREARQSVARRLYELGYEISGSDDSAPKLSTDSGATAANTTRPPVTLHVSVTPADEAQGIKERLHLGPVLVVTAITLTALLCASICLLMMRRLWRILKAPAAEPKTKAGARSDQTTADLAEVMPKAAPAMLSGLSPADERQALQAVAPSAHSQHEEANHDLRAAVEKMLPALPTGSLKVATTAHHELPPLPAEFNDFEDLPFDLAVRTLAKFDATMRHTILERLGINKALRQRIEQELHEIQAT